MSERLTPEREAEIAARAEAATPGPWETHPEYGVHFYAYLGGSYLRGVGTLNFGEGNDAEADKALTVNAREDIRDLLAELAAVRAERDQARRKVEELACPVCNGSGLDPDDEGDWDSAVGRHNPTTIAPCPTCMGDRTRQGGAR